MKRRKFIWLSGAGIAAATLPWLTSCQSSPWTAILSVPSVLGQFCSEMELMAIGKSYTDQIPEESQVSTLEKQLLVAEDGDTYTPQSETSLITFINHKSEQDFAMSKTIIVQGWVLSRTEARQCGLFYLTHTNS